MTHEHTANEEARHGNRDALEQVTRERDRLREALRGLIDQIRRAKSDDVTVRMKDWRSAYDKALAALEDDQ